MVITAITVTKVLLGHTSQETAHQVDDYPYGFKLRCKMRCWIEHKPKLGYRFVQQTSNPKNPLATPTRPVWNKPKAGQYSKIAMAMYVDEKGHVQHTALSEYCGPERVAAYLEHFPCPADLRVWVKMKIHWYKRAVEVNQEGKTTFAFSTNGVENKPKEGEVERDLLHNQKELAEWEALLPKVQP